MRDAQHQKVYDAESAFWGHRDPDMSKEEVWGVLRDLSARSGQEFPIVDWGRKGQTRALGGRKKEFGHTPWISLPERHRTVPTICHELAHAWLASQSTDEIEAHGGLFIQTYTWVVSLWYGDSVAASFRSFLEGRGVRVRPESVKV